MLSNSKAKIFLAGERSHTETEWFRRYSTFNFGSFQKENKQAFGPLYLLNDETLANSNSHKMTAEEDSLVVLIPIVGAIQVKHDLGNESIVAAGEIEIFSVPINSSIEFTNPYEGGLVNFLQLWLKMPLLKKPFHQHNSFDLEKDKNILLNIFTPDGDDPPLQNICIGKFSGREEADYRMLSPANNAFIFVIDGAFEVNNRLLEKGDGLALWNTQAVEMEALSNNALVLLIEIRS